MFFFCAPSYWWYGMWILATLYFEAVHKATREQRSIKFETDCLSAWKFVEREKSFHPILFSTVNAKPYHKLKRIYYLIAGDTKLAHFVFRPFSPPLVIFNSATSNHLPMLPSLPPQFHFLPYNTMCEREGERPFFPTSNI